MLSWGGFNVLLDMLQVTSKSIFPANLLTDAFSTNHLADRNKKLNITVTHNNIKTWTTVQEIY